MKDLLHLFFAQGEQGLRGESGGKGERGADGQPGRDAVSAEGEAIPGPRGPPVSETQKAEPGVISD